MMEPSAVSQTDSLNTRFNRRRTLVLVLGATLGLLILISGHFLYTSAQRATLDQFNQRQLAVVNGTSASIEFFFNHIAEGMRVRSTNPKIQRLEEEETRAEITELLGALGELGVSDIGVLDSEGILRYGVMAPQIEGMDFSFREYFSRASEIPPGTPSYVMEFIDFRGVDLGQKGVLVAIPIYNSLDSDSPEFNGVMLATVRMNAINERFVEPIKTSENSSPFMLDEEYSVLWSSDDSLRWRDLMEVGEPIEGFVPIHNIIEENRAATSLGQFYVLTGTTPDATSEIEEKIVAVVPVHLGEQTWTLGIWAPLSDARDLLLRMYIELVVLGTFVISTALGVTIYVVRLYSRLHSTLEREIATQTEIADTLQGALIGKMEIPDGIEVGYHYRSATDAALVGGDFYDVYRCGSNCLGITVGDVSGKGLSAAATTSSVKSVVRLLTRQGLDVAEVASKVDQMLLEDQESTAFVTCFIGVLDLETLVLSHCTAGHPPAIVIRNLGASEIGPVGSPALGLLPGSEFSAAKESLKIGDKLLLYTDGVIEVRRDGQLFGSERLIKAAIDTTSVPVADLPSAIFELASEFGYDQIQDDVAILALAINAKPE